MAKPTNHPRLRLTRKAFTRQLDRNTALREEIQALRRQVKDLLQPPAENSATQLPSAGEKLAEWGRRLRFDEPVFTLRAQDITAPNSVRRWAASVADLLGSKDKIGDAMLTAARMEHWQRRYGCKVPD